MAAFSGGAFASVDNIHEVAIIGLKGDVKADLKGDGTWVTCWNDLKLMKGAVLKTGADSSVEIAFDMQGLNVLKLGANTQVTIDDSLVKLSQGSVIARFKNLKPGSSFTVKTPNAACGIRGSGMGVDFINNMTVVSAFEDKVYVQGLDAVGNPVGAVVEIPEGWKSQVEAGNIEPPVGLTENELQVWNAFVEAVAAGVGTEAEAAAAAAETGQGEVDTKDLSDEKTGAAQDEPVISPSGSSDSPTDK